MKRNPQTPLSFSALEESLRQRDFSPVYLIYGEEDFLIEEAVTSLIDAALEESTRGFNLDIVYGHEVDANRIAALASSYPMMAERRVVVVREFDKLSNKESLQSYITHPSPTTVFVVLSAKPDFRLKVYKTLKESAVTLECKPMYESDIPPWIAKRMEERGKSISFEACRVLQSYVGRSLREIHNEMEKLRIYVGKRKRIEIDDVNMIVGMSRQYNVYELQNAIGMRDVSRGLEILEHMLNGGEAPIKIIVVLTQYFQKMWVLRDCIERKSSREEIITLLRISPKQKYWLDADLQKAHRFTLQELELCFSLLREADRRLKTSNGDAKLVMTLLLYRLVKGKKAEIEA